MVFIKWTIVRRSSLEMDTSNDNLRIQFLSDLHLESKNRYGDWWVDVIEPQAPYLVLAGDICPSRHPDLPRFYDWCKDNFERVIHIPGNHEYWKYKRNKYDTISEAETYMKSLCEKHGIIFAQKDIIELEKNGPKLICCTLWSRVPKGVLNNDYSRIKEFNPRIRNNIYFDHLNFIKEAVRNEEIAPIIITHHAPLIDKTQRPEHIGGKEAPFYTNSLGWLIDKCTAWIFGHTHHVCDIYRRGGSVVTSNPIGHVNENLPYDRAAVLSVRYRN